MSRKKLMILGAGHYQVPLIRKAQEMGLFAIAVSRPGQYPGFRIADRIYEIDTKDKEAILGAARAEQIDGIVTTGTDVAVRAIGYVSDALALHGISYPAAVILTDKARMKEAFRGRVSTSDFRVVRTLTEAAEAAEELGFPVMVKACDVSGSRGVVKVSDPSGLEEAFLQAVRASHTDHYVVECFEEGEEIGLDAFVSDGRILVFQPHRKLNLSVGPVTIPAGHVFPLKKDEETFQRIYRELENIIAASGMDNCAVNCDMIIRKDGSISVLEAGGRSGATCIPELIEIHTGIDYYGLMIRSALGEACGVRAVRAVPCAASLIFSRKEGCVAGINRKMLSSLQVPGTQISLDLGVGDHVFALHDGTDRIGQVIGTAPDIGIITEIAEKAGAVYDIRPENVPETPKKLMLLGGGFFQQTATIAAKKAGYHVISVDYLPDNPAHRYADEYCNISTTDMEGVLSAAAEREIDGIMTWASDASAPTVSYVAEKLGLPCNPYESVMILTHKDRFRDFLRKHGFPAPKGRSFRSSAQKNEAYAFACSLAGPFVVKPADSSGSRGVAVFGADAAGNKEAPASGTETAGSCAGTASVDPSAFGRAFEEALSFSRSGTVLAEEFVRREGYQIDGDIFVDDGKIVFWGICDQHNDPACSKFTPAAHSFPSVQAEALQAAAKAQVEEILRLLGMRMGEFNLEYIAGEDGRIYIMELGPRSGGNMIPDVLREACDMDFAEAAAQQAAGDYCGAIIQREPWRCAASWIVHSDRDGVYRGLEIDPRIRGNIIEKRMFVREGDEVRHFRNASCGIGAILIAFEDVASMNETLLRMNEYIRVLVG